MGWDGRKRTIAEAVEELNKNFRDGVVLLESSLEVETGYSVLWQLLVDVDTEEDCGLVILCNLLESRPGGWVYTKTIDSDCGPLYYSVPQGWLDRKVYGREGSYHAGWRLKALTYGGRQVA